MSGWEHFKKGSKVEDKTSLLEALSPRQKEILRLIAQHHQAKEIARILNISESTVKTHTDEARRRLGVPTSRAAARLLLSHEGAGPPASVETGLPPEGGPPSKAMADQDPVVASSDHEHDLSSRRELSPDELERPGGGLADAGSTRQARTDRGHDQDAAFVEYQGGAGKSGLYHGGGDRLADGRWPDGQGQDGRWDAFTRRLEALSALQWVGLIVLLSVLMPLIAGVLIQAGHTTFQAFQEFNR